MWSPPTQVRVTSGWMRFTLPLQGWRSWFRRVSSHYSNIHPYVVFQRSHALNSSGLILQFCCLYGTAWCMLHFLCCTEQSHWFHCQIPEHTQGVSVPQCHTYFYDVLLWHRGDIKQSAIFLVTINTHILVLRWGSLDGTWSLLEAVTEVEVDIMF